MILVVAEQRGGKLNRATWETIAAAQQTRGRRVAITVAVPGAGRGSRWPPRLAAARRGRRSSSSSIRRSTRTRPTAYMAALAAAVAALAPSLVLLPHTYQTRDFAPKLAARLDRALVTDVTGIKAVGGERAVRPADVSGQARRPTSCRRAPRRTSSTFQIGAFRADRRREGRVAGAGRARWPSTIDAAAIRQKPEPPFQEAKQAVDLSQAERIVAVGPRHQGAGAPPARAGTGRRPRRRARRVAADLRRRLAADGAPGRQLRPDGRAEAVSGARHLRRDSAPGRHEGLADHRRRSTRTPTRPSSKWPTTASSATCSRSCRRSSRRSKPDRGQPWRP